jgi:hypothetical protein
VHGPGRVLALDRPLGAAACDDGGRHRDHPRALAPALARAFGLASSPTTGRG